MNKFLIIITKLMPLLKLAKTDSEGNTDKKIVGNRVLSVVLLILILYTMYCALVGAPYPQQFDDITNHLINFFTNQI